MIEEMADAAKGTYRASRWSLNGMTALVTGGTRGIGSVPLFIIGKGIFWL